MHCEKDRAHSGGVHNKEVIGSCGNSPAPARNTISMERPGRNDLCPCGSGKKYKKCCLPREASREQFAAALESTALPLLSRLARFAESAANAPLETIARETFPFWRGKLDKAQGARIVDFLMFEFRPKHFGRRTIEQFAMEVLPSLAPEGRAMLEQWVDAPRRLYRVADWSGGFTTCADALDQARPAIDVFDVEGAWKPKPGEPFALRPLSVGELYVCAGRPIAYDGRDAEDVADAVRRRHLDFVRTQRIAGIDDFLRLATTALDEESAYRAASSTIVLPHA
jgi:hypothetical protein